MESQWLTSCPKCGAKDQLIVTSATLSATGETLHVNSKLEPDGFGFEYDGKDASTEAEIVLCTNCKRRYYLEELSVENKEGYRVVEKKVYVVSTVSTFGDDQYFGDILLITEDKAQADNLVERFNTGENIDEFDRDNLVENDGQAVVFERILGKAIKDFD
jgi:hypothetical protein